MSLYLQTTGTPIELLAYDAGDGGYVTVRYVDGSRAGRVRCVPVARVKATGGQVELHQEIHKARVRYETAK